MDRVKRRLLGIREILFKEQRRILSTVTTLMLLSIITKFSGLLFNALLAGKFGASRPTDIFTAANAIPEMITTTILIGAVSGSIIPVLIRSKENETQEDFMRFFSSLFNLGFLIFLVISVVIVIFSNDLVFLARDLNIIDPIVPFKHEEYEMIGNMMRLLMIPQAILGISAYISSALNVYERFIIPSFAPLFYNIGRIVGVYTLVDVMGGDIMGVVWGTYIGAFLHLIIQLPLLFHLGFSYKFVIDFRSKYLKDVIKLSLPRMFSLAGEQISFVVNKVIAISLQIGALSALNFAYSLITIPMNLVGVSYAVAAFPSMSKFYEKGDMEAFSRLFKKILNQIFFFAVPMSVLIFVLRIPFTRLLFGILGGKFSWEDTQQVAWVIFFFSLGLAFETLRSFMFRVFYSVHDSRKPLLTSIFVMIVGIVTAIGLTNYFSHFNGYDINNIAGQIQVADIEVKNSGTPFDFQKFEVSPKFNLFPQFSLDKFFVRGEGSSAVGGIALSASIVFILEFILLFGFLWKKHVIQNMSSVLAEMIKKMLAGVAMIGATYFMFKFWEQILNTTKTLELLFLTIIIIIASVVFYMWVCLILRIEEVYLIFDYIIEFYRLIEKRFPILRGIRERI